jgi:hypothetical protein
MWSILNRRVSVVFLDCVLMLGPTTFPPECEMENSKVLLQAVAKTVLLAQEAGLEIDDLLELLSAGLTVADVLELIVLRLTCSAGSAGVFGGGPQLVGSRPMVC